MTEKLIDYHLHTSLCRHAIGSLDEYVEAALQKGLSEIGFADHFPLGLLDFWPEEPVTMDPGELEGYLRDIREVALRSEIPVKTGLEVDYLPGKTEKTGELLRRCALDYVIGSVHFMGSWDFTHPRFSSQFQGCSLENLYRSYFDLVWKACYSGLFDIIGHIDVIKKFGYRPGRDFLVSLYGETARVLRETGVALEINTAGLVSPARELYPSEELLQVCLQEGVAVTLGSDAHSPSQVGRFFPEARTMLRRMGLEAITAFSNRQPYPISI